MSKAKLRNSHRLEYSPQNTETCGQRSTRSFLRYDARIIFAVILILPLRIRSTRAVCRSFSLPYLFFVWILTSPSPALSASGSHSTALAARYPLPTAGSTRPRLPWLRTVRCVLCQVFMIGLCQYHLHQAHINLEHAPLDAPPAITFGYGLSCEGTRANGPMIL